MVAEIASIHNNGSRYCYHLPELVFRRWVIVDTVATVATVHAMVAKLLPFKTSVAKIATLMVAIVAGFATMVAATLATLKLAYRILQSGHNVSNNLHSL